MVDWKEEVSVETEAYLSEDRLFRYWLLRRWHPTLPLLAVIGCNPSTADETVNDPTIRKIMGFAERLRATPFSPGFGGVLMLNVGAFRATDPKEWKAARDPFGPENTVTHLQEYLAKFSPVRIIAAWGKCCTASQRGEHRAREIARCINGLECWGKNSDGSPRHPLMLSYSTTLVSFNKP